jgi:hypothetical protein
MLAHQQLCSFTRFETQCWTPESQQPNTWKSVCLVCFVDPTPYLVDLPGSDPQKPPAAAFPEPRLNILGAL